MALNLKSKKARGVLNVIFSIGAAVVIFGALAKIEHWGGLLGRALEVGMLTETFVFLLMALQPAEENYYWERVFPDLNMSPDEERRLKGSYKPQPLALPVSGGQPALDQMDKMMRDADITPANLKRLGDNFQRLGTTVEKMQDVANVVSVTGEYAQRTKEASGALEKLRDVYGQAAHTFSSFTTSAQSAQAFHDQLQVMTKNLASLNAIYELELQDTNNHLKSMNKFYGNLTAASESMAGTIEDTKKTQQQVSLLARNLSSLNSVYGNMLSAMHIKG